jgi:hypothetical protein
MVSTIGLPGFSLTKEVINMRRLLTTPSAEAVRAENIIAMALSIVAPGLGQVYKGHVAGGLIWMFVGMPIVLWVGILLSLATAGVGLIVPLVCWAALVIDAYWEKDRRSHHWFMGNGVDEDYSAAID